MKIYVIRHGQTTGDVEDRYGGAYDDELTEIGRKQAIELAGKLESSGIEKLYCSPMIRVKQTSEILQVKLGCEIEVIEDLRERNKNGILTGMTKGEAMTKYPKLVEDLKDFRNQIEGAESQEIFVERIKSVIKKVTSESKHSIVGLVTHGGPMWAIFTDILGNKRIREVEDCAYMVLSEKDGKMSLERTDGISLSLD